MGNELFQEVAQATGLPLEIVEREFSKLLAKKGIARDEVTLENLREAMAEFLKEVILHAKDKYENGTVIHEEVAPEDLGRESN